MATIGMDKLYYAKITEDDNGEEYLLRSTSKTMLSQWKNDRIKHQRHIEVNRCALFVNVGLHGEGFRFRQETEVNLPTYQ
jgi:hypothetical protein